MKAINLLPRKPKLQKYFIPLLAAVIFVSLSGGLLAVWSLTQSDSSIARLQDAIAKNQKRLQQQTAVRQVDPMTQTFNSLSQQIADLKKARMNWISIMDMLSTRLPAASRILSVNASEQRKLTVALEFGSIPDVADYLISLQTNGAVDTVNVTTLARTERHTDVKTSVIPPASGGKTVRVAAASAGPTPKPTVSPKSGSLSQSTPNSTSASPGEDLLQQLQQALAQKWGTTGVTQMPSAQTTPASAADAPGTYASSPTQDSKGASAATLAIYSVTIEVLLKTTTPSK